MDIDKCWYKDICKEQCSNSCVRFIVMNLLCEQSGIPVKLRFPNDLYAQPEDLDAFVTLKDYKDDILAHVNNGDNLYIYSKQCGNGKTTWASKMLMKYFDSIWHIAGIQCKALFIHTSDFLIRCKEHFRKDDVEFDKLVEQCKQVSLIVWDDVSFPSLTDFERELFLSVLDYRFNNGLANIFTGNLDENNLRDRVDSRIFSRIWNNSLRVKISSNDQRGVLT